MLHLTPTVFVWLAEYYLFFASQYNYYRGTERNFTYIQRRSASKQGTTTLYVRTLCYTSHQGQRSSQSATPATKQRGIVRA